MTEIKDTNKLILPDTNAPQQKDNQLDSAEKSLSDALAVSFTILKIIMVVLLVLFFISGFKTVEPDQQALVLRFGKIRGQAEDRLLKPGLHWVLPYPIEEMVKIPVTRKVDMSINNFWYYQTKDEILQLQSNPDANIRVQDSLDPLRDGYALTRSQKTELNLPGATESDYNLVHTKWRLTYSIADPELFFKNVNVADQQQLAPGQTYADAISQSIEPLLTNIIADAVVTAMVNFSIDDAIESRAAIPAQVHQLAQQKLREIQSGIHIENVKLTQVAWPRQVDQAFQAYVRASQTSEREISQAKGYAENTLNETAGPVADEIYQLIKGLKQFDPDSENYLWDQLAGQARQQIAQAHAYRTKVVESAKADAEYLNNILPEYRKRPQLVLQKIYLDAIESVLENTDEKLLIQPTDTEMEKEIRVLINRDPANKKNNQSESGK